MKTLTLLLFMIATEAYGQTGSCERVYSNPDTPPQYEGDLKGLSDYVWKEIAPIITKCVKRDKEFIESLHILFTIDQQGNVIDASFLRPDLKIACKDDLRKKIMTMKRWKPAQQNGRSVCSYYPLPIGCFLWN